MPLTSFNRLFCFFTDLGFRDSRFFLNWTLMDARIFLNEFEKILVYCKLLSNLKRDFRRLNLWWQRINRCFWCWRSSNWCFREQFMIVNRFLDRCQIFGIETFNRFIEFSFLLKLRVSYLYAHLSWFHSLGSLFLRILWFNYSRDVGLLFILANFLLVIFILDQFFPIFCIRGLFSKSRTFSSCIRSVHFFKLNLLKQVIRYDLINHLLCQLWPKLKFMTRLIVNPCLKKTLWVNHWLLISFVFHHINLDSLF